MNEAKYELLNWIKWKRTVSLLKETKEQLLDMKKAIPFTDGTEMPGGNHKSIHEKLQKIIDDCEQYDIIISSYHFLIKRLEDAVNTVLSDEQKKVAVIYANNRNSKTRDYKAVQEGFTRATYYRILDDVFEELNKILV